MNNVQILDCTLRDGSYAVDFGFTIDDTVRICRALEDAGFDLIEVAHGSGLGASSPELGIAAATDEEYVRAAAGALKRARFGAFFIPGIGTNAHLDMARDYGMSFIRIGTNITRSEDARESIEYARRLGFEVSYNAMKTYTVSVDECQKRLMQAVEWGAECVHVVDSSGGMLPHEVREYVKRLADATDARVGFHGHNNLGLANANTLAALEAGATRLDATILGMGRSTGNAQTEALLVILEKLGYDTGINLLKAMAVGDELIAPLMRTACGIPSLEITVGAAHFHSSYMPRIEQACSAFGVDPRRLIIEVSKIDKVNPSEALIMSVAERCAKELSRT